MKLVIAIILIFFATVLGVTVIMKCRDFKEPKK